MTLAGLWEWSQANGPMVAMLAAAVPAVVFAVAGVLRVAGRQEASQQVANGGIALGLTAVLIEVMGLVFHAQHWGVESLGGISLATLLAPGWLLVAGAGVEHLLHPDRQEGVRSRVRGMVLSLVVLGVLAAVFSVLRIYMVVFSGIFGFVLFLAAIVAVFWLILRYLF